MINTSKTGTSYKIRRSGNSDVVTVSSDVKEALGLVEGDSVSYEIADGQVRLVKKKEEIDLDVLINKSINQYHSLIEKLVDL